MTILFDCRPVRDPISGVARYCLGVSEALMRTPGAPLELFVQDQGGANTFLSELSQGAVRRDARFFAEHRQVQNLLLEFVPRSAALLLGTGQHILHETYFANLGRFRRTRKVATIHDVIPLDRPELFSRRNAVFARRNFYRQVREADAIIAVSDYTRQRILDLAPEAEDRITVIGNGVNSVILNGPDVAPLEPGDLLSERPFVCCVGNVEPRKNLVTLARGFDLAFPADSGWQLVLAGRKNFEAEPILAEITRLLGDRFTYLGPVSEARKWQVLAYAKATAMTAEYEGFGIPIYESYAVNTPVMIADNSSMSELAVRPEQLFETFNAEALAEGFRQIAAGADWVAPAVAAGRKRVAQATWDHVAAKTRKIYDQLS